MEWRQANQWDETVKTTSIPDCDLLFRLCAPLSIEISQAAWFPSVYADALKGSLQYMEVNILML